MTVVLTPKLGLQTQTASESEPLITKSEDDSLEITEDFERVSPTRLNQISRERTDCILTQRDLHSHIQETKRSES